MATRVHERESFSLEELEQKWGITKERLQELMLAGQLVPSFVINHVGYKVRFTWVVDDGDDDGGHWEPRVTGELVDDDNGGQRHRMYWTDDVYYLLHPERRTKNDCIYAYFSRNRDHSKGEDDGNICFMFTMKGSHPLSKGITLNMAYRDGFVLLDEVKRFEREHPEVLEATQAVITDKAKALNRRATTTYLNIIGGLLELMLGTTPSGRRGSIYESQSAIIDALLSSNDGKPGIAKSTLEQKFSDAKRSIKATERNPS